jgi:large subunit ribosomal protein L22
MTQTTKKNTTAIKKVSTKKVVTKKVVDKKTLNKAEGKPVEVTKTVKTAKYLNKDIQLSPRKLRLLVNDVRKFTPVEALNRVKFVNTKAARIMVKALTNIIADAKNNFNLDTNSLQFDTIKADEALKLKRMDKSHGSRYARGLIQKRHSRLVIIIKGVQK